MLADVTDRRQAEELLRRSEERYRTLFEAVDVGFCVVEMMFDDALRPVDYRFVEANPAFERQTGMVGATGRWVSETAPGLEQHWYDTYGRVALTGVSERFENEAQPLDRWFDVYAFRTGAAHEHRVAILFTDITVRRRAEQHLRELNETLERRVAETSADLDRVWTNAGDIFVVLDAEGVFRRVNPATTAILGWSEAELIGRPVFDFVHPHDLALTGDALVQARGRALPMVENRYRTKDGRFRRIAWVTAPEGRWIYAYGRDVTEERERQAELEETQDALRQAQKMEAVGQLTGGIAHDFNNMLAVVMGSLDLLGRRFGAGDPRALRYIEAARDGARRAALLTQRLLAFARQQPLRPEAVDVKQLVLGMSGLIRGSLGSEIRFETEFADGGWRVHVDPNQLENALLNLAVNARDAMPEGGRMTIETRHVEHEPADAAAAARHPAGAWVRISVRDTGTGMSPEVIAKAFDPFFTTKAVGRGTGLGLSQVYGFVRQSGGQVEIHSAPGRGTTIDLQLPRFLGGPAPSAEASLSGGGLPLSRAQETILVVDDEPAVRQLSLDALGELGYRVLEADGAAAALQQLERHPEIALLFTDIVMPETNGRKLAEEARRLRPGLRVLFTTGYTSDAGVHQDALAPGVDLIGKPFSIAALAAKLRAVLAVRKFGSPEPE